MKFGDALIYDYRTTDPCCSTIAINDKIYNSATAEKVPISFRGGIGQLSVVQFNIERGYQLEKIIKLILECNADIICLQEIDINCIRSHRVNCALEIAKRLKLKCICVVEFEELSEKGIHGNAILSKLDFELESVIMHSEIFDWNNKGKFRGEARVGQRCTMACTFMINGNTVVVYSAHLEVFTGIMGRITQISEIFEYAANHDAHYQILCGDLNTLGHGIARLSPNYCNDQMRFKSIGYSESEFFYDRVLKYNMVDGPLNEGLLGYGLSDSVVEAARNPGFIEVFDLNEITLTSYGGAFQGKLDWFLIKGFGVQKQFMKNNDFSASDHKLLYCTLVDGPYSDPNKNIEVKRKNSLLVTVFALSTAAILLSWYIKRK